jgi:alkanesulfonate monooxygenase SsuD/methylene tetrahydromethanopterin reductase-like flavin-dependent oxidoreductase (luciferase family)
MVKMVAVRTGLMDPSVAADWRVAKSIFVADDAGTARRYGTGPDSPYQFYFKQLMTKLIGNGRADLFKGMKDMPDSAVTFDYVVDSLVIAGTPASVTDQLLALRERIGDFGTLVYAGHDRADKALGRHAMELMAPPRSCRASMPRSERSRRKPLDGRVAIAFGAA